MDRLHDYSELLYLLREAQVYTNRLKLDSYTMELKGMIGELTVHYLQEQRDARDKARSGKG